ncbi:unnamed protein product [Rotaria socialis]|uniref:TTF-type domain-containing protein n=1 Tax=Rotaria socialis TaxID=392032 RepID=A0A821HAU0_9BILA|nr:unnamed protein product [Rotaria socialis]
MTLLPNDASSEDNIEKAILATTPLTTNAVSSSSSSVSEPEVIAPKPSTNEPGCDLTDHNIIDTNEITSIVNELGELQSLLCTCEHLIKQSQTSDFSEEVFTIDTNLFFKSLKDITTRLEHLCNKQTLKTKQSRGVAIVSTKIKSNFTSRDPGDNRKYNDDELRYLVSYGPYHDLNVSYPQNLELKKKNKQCSFTSNWYKDFPYLGYSIKKNAVFCFCCRLFGFGPGSEKCQAAWSSTGVSVWSKMTGQDGKLVKHFKSISHITAENRLVNFSQKNRNVDLMLDAGQRRADQKREAVLKLNEKIVVTLLDVSRFLSRQSLAFQGDTNSEENFIAAVNMMRRRDPSTYLHYDSQNEFIQLLGSAVHKEIYSIIVRFVKKFIAQERIISVSELNSKTGVDICEHILDQLKRCVQHGSCISIDYINCFGILQELYNFFTGSIKGYSLLCDELKKTSHGLLVKDLSTTRWSDRYESIRAVITSYQEITNTLQNLADHDIEKKIEKQQ